MTADPARIAAAPGAGRETWSGLLLVDKPAGVTSHDVVDRARRRLRARGAGHLGTLDPAASGLLVLALGAATRCATVWQSGAKTYEATVRFGVVTSTQDLQGEVLERREVALTEAEVRAAAVGFVGPIEQVPPMVSALKVDGRRLYRLARRGEVVERRARAVRVHSWEWLDFDLPEANIVLDEVGQIADRVTVLRAGRVVASCCETPGVDKASLARMMVGKEVILQVSRPPRAPGAPVLQVRNVCLRDPTRQQPLLNDVSFEVREGQVLGIAAVAGNGLGELEDALTGMCGDGILEGEALLNGNNILCRSTAYLREIGVAYVPADRLNRGSSLPLPLGDNLIAVDHQQFLKNGFFRAGLIATFVRGLIERFGIRGGVKSAVGTLSGGNIQRAVLSRELSRETSLLVVCEPTWGLDIVSSEFVYTVIMEMRMAGKAILLLSSNLDEVLALSDRIAVMYKGEVAGMFDNDCLDRESLGDYMMGLKRQDLKGSCGPEGANGG